MSNKRTGASQFLYLLITVQVIGLFGLFVKKVQMELNSGYLTILRFLGKTSLSELSFIDRLSFFREDILLYFVILPVAIYLLSYKFVLRVKILSFILFSTVLAILFYIGLYSLANVGHFLSTEMLTEAVIWGINDPHIIPEYLSLSGVVKLVSLIIVASVLLFIGKKYAFGNLWQGRLSLVIMVFAVGFATVGYTSSIQNLPQHKSILTNMFLVMTASDHTSNKYRGYTEQELIQAYNNLIQIDGGVKEQQILGTEKDADLLIFILETTPTRCIDFTKSSDELPGIERLKEHAIVSANHFTTYPYTRDALFSILASQYPANLNRILKFHAEKNAFGLMTTLKKYNYSNIVYSPAKDMMGYDNGMLYMIGADSIYFNGRSPFQEEQVQKRTEKQILSVQEKNKNVSSAVLARFEDLLYNDLMTLEKLKSDIIANKKSGKKFVSLFLPQLTHAPWLNLYNRDNVVACGKDVMEMKLSWLDEIISLLEENDWLKNSVIVVTGDHGVRNRTEDKDFVRGKDIDYAFNVPLLLYAPNTITEYTELDYATSHIDIAPTLLALFGIRDSSFAMQGLPLRDERIKERNIYLLARDYYGIDGYYDNDNFYMFEYLTGVTSRSKDIRFLTDEILSESENVRVKDYLQKMYDISEMWFEKYKLPNMPSAG